MDSLGKAVVDILIQLTGADTSVSKLKTFFTKIESMAAVASGSLSSLKEDVKSVNTEASKLKLKDSFTGVNQKIKQTTRSLADNNRMVQLGVKLANRSLLINRQAAKENAAILAAKKAGLVSVAQAQKAQFQAELRRRQALRRENNAPQIDNTRSRNNFTRTAIARVNPDRAALKNYRKEVNALESAYKRGIITEKQYKRGLKDISTQTRINALDARLYSSGMMQQARLFRTVGQEMRTVGRSMAFAGLAIAAAFAAPLISFSKFEQATQDVVAVLGELNTQADREFGFELLSGTFKNIGETTEFTATQIGEAARQLGLAGFKLSEVNASVRAVADLASAGNTDLVNAAQISASIGKAFGIQADDFTRISDVLAKTATQSNVTVESLGESFKLLGPVAASLGQPLEEIAAAVGALGNAGIRGSRTGTGLARAFTELLEKSDDFDEKLKSIGSSFAKIDPTRNSLSDIVREFERLKKAGDLDTEDFFSLFDQRSARVVVSLINQGSESLDKLNDAALKSAGAAESIRKQRLDTVAGDYKIALSALQTTLIELGGTAAPVLRQILKFAARFFRVITSVSKAFEGTLGNLIIGLAGLAATLTTVGLAVSVFGTAIQALGIKILVVEIAKAAISMGVFSASTNTAIASMVGLEASAIASGSAMSVALGPIGLVVVALAALAAGAYIVAQSFDDTTARVEMFKKSFTGVEKRVNAITQANRDLAKGFALYKNLPNLTELEVKLLINGELPTIDNFKDKIRNTAEEISNLEEMLQKSVDNVENTTAEFAKDTGQLLFGGGLGALGLVGDTELLLGIEVFIDKEGVTKVRKQIAQADWLGSREITIEADITDFQEDTQIIIRELAILKTQEEKLFKDGFALNELNKAFSSRDGADNFLVASRENVEILEEKLERLNIIKNGVFASEEDKKNAAQTSAFLEKQLESQKKNVILGTDLAKLSDKRLKQVSDIRKAVSEIQKINDNVNLSEEMRATLIKEQLDKATALSKILRQESLNIEKGNKFLEERKKILDDIFEKAAELEKQELDANKTKRQIELEENDTRIRELQKSISVDNNDRSKEDGAELSTLDNKLDAIKAKEKELSDLRDRIDRQGLKGEDLVNAEDDAEALGESIERLKKEAESFRQDQLRQIETFRRNSAAINAKFDAEDAKAAEEKRLKDEALLIKNLKLDLDKAKLNDNVPEQIRLTKEVTEKEIVRQADSDFGTDADLSKDRARLKLKQDFLLKSRQELQRKLDKIVQDAADEDQKIKDAAIKAAAENALALKKLKLEEAKRVENLKKILKLTKEIQQAENAEEVAERFPAEKLKNDKKLQMEKAEFEKELAKKTQGELSEIAKSFADKAAKAKAKNAKKNTTARKQQITQQQRRQSQLDINNQLTKQVRTIADAARLTRFLHNLEKKRRDQLKKDVNRQIRFSEAIKKAQLKGDSEKVARFQARAALLQGEISKQGGPDLGFLSGQNKKPVNPFKNPNNQNNNAQATTPNATAVVPAATATAANPAVAAAAAAAAAAANPAAATTPLPMSSPTAPVPSTNPKAPTSSPANTPKVPPTTSNSKAIPQFTFTEGAIQIIGSGLEKEEVIEVAEVAVIGAIEKAVAGTA